MLKGETKPIHIKEAPLNKGPFKQVICDKMLQNICKTFLQMF